MSKLIHKQCPLCGAILSLGSRTLTRKIRCPQCREVVTISAPVEKEPAATAAQKEAKEPAPTAQAQALQPLSLPEDAPEFIVAPLWQGPGLLNATQKTALLEHLTGDGDHHISIRAAANDPDALMLSHSLRKLFRQAGWNASESPPLPNERRRDGGLALYAGTWPFPDEVTKSCMALRAAGLQFTSHINPLQAREKVVLVVGREVGSLKDAGQRPGEARHAVSTEETHDHPIFEEMTETAWDEEVKGPGKPGESCWLQRIHQAAAREPRIGRRLKPGALLERGVRLAEVLAKHLSEGSDRGTVLRELNLVMAELRKAAAVAGARVERAPHLVRECARLALALLEEGPGEIDRRLPEGPYRIPEQSTWVAALQFADAALAHPPASDDPQTQSAFERVLTSAFQGSAPPLQQIIAVEVRAWHWFRTPERRALHDELFYEHSSCQNVLAIALGRLQHWQPAERERIMRGLLQRGDIVECETLAETLGYALGWESMCLDKEEQRLPAAALAREVMEEPSTFPMLDVPALRREFLRLFVVGMTEGAKELCGHPALAEDFAAWCHRAWLELEPLEEGKDPRCVVLFAIYWLGDPRRKEGSKELAHWWRCVFGMLLDVVRRGGMRDIHTLFTTLRDGAFEELATVDELLALIEAHLARVEEELEGGMPDQKDFAGGFSDEVEWSEITGCISEMLADLLHQGRLAESGNFEAARKILQRLTVEFNGSAKAAEALQLFEWAD